MRSGATGYSAKEFADYHGEAEDAYTWHLSRLRLGDRLIDGYAATGNGGRRGNELVSGHIIPATGRGKAP